LKKHEGAGANKTGHEPGLKGKGSRKFNPPVPLKYKLGIQVQ